MFTYLFGQKICETKNSSNTDARCRTNLISFVFEYTLKHEFKHKHSSTLNRLNTNGNKLANSMSQSTYYC